MFGRPVGEVMRSMTSLEFQAWGAYRNRRGFALRGSHDLLARLTWAFNCANRGKDSAIPELGDFLPAARVIPDGDDRYTPEERKTLATLMRDNT